MEIKKKNSKI